MKDMSNVYISAIDVKAKGEVSFTDALADAIELAARERNDVDLWYGGIKYRVSYGELLDLIHTLNERRS